MKRKFKAGDVVTWNKRDPKDTTPKKARLLTIKEVDEKNQEYVIMPQTLEKDGIVSLVHRSIPFEREDDFDLVETEQEEKKIVLELTPEEYKYLHAKLNTFDYWHSGQTRGICPKCGEYIIIDGYVCFGCGFDKSAADWEERMKLKRENEELNAENAE